MMTRHLDLTFVIVWSLAIANVLGAGLCLLLAKPIARLALVPFALLAPFMIAIIYLAAYQVTRVWYDLITPFVLGILGVYMKRFGWSPASAADRLRAGAAPKGVALSVDPGLRLQLPRAHRRADHSCADLAVDLRGGVRQATASTARTRWPARIGRSGT
jgi:hypothetical protein